MTTGKVRATGCSRFLFAMVFIVPGAYFLSMFITGESIDFKQKFNDLMGKETIEQVDDSPKKEKKKNTTTLNESKETKKEPSKKETSISQEDLKKVADYKSRIARLEAELDQKNKQLETLYKKIEEKDQGVKDSEKQCDATKLELKEVRQQLEKIKKAIGQ